MLEEELMLEIKSCFGLKVIVVYLEGLHSKYKGALYSTYVNHIKYSKEIR